MIGNYRSDAYAYDELRDAAGQPRPHWQGLLEQLSTGTGTVLDSRAPDTAQQALQQACADLTQRTSAYLQATRTDTQLDGSPNPWRLDALPYLLAEADWRLLESGLRQRAEILNLLLSDFYGPQR